MALPAHVARATDARATDARATVASSELAASNGQGPLLPGLWQYLQRLQTVSAGGLSERAEELRRLCRHTCDLHGISVELVGQLPQGPAVFVSNHLGYIDPVVLCSLVACSPIAKIEIRAWPLVGEPLSRLNVCFVRRGSALSGARVLRQCLRTLEAGVSVLNFPEGTTSRGGLLPFQLGAFWLARRSGLPLVPVGIEFEAPDMCWVDDEGFLPHYGRVLWGRWQGVRRKVRVNVGQALDAGQFRSVMDASWAARSAISALRLPYGASLPESA
jgi:1-acyl-sn-glycerol-3-phosphate acyltransferase